MARPGSALLATLLLAHGSLGCDGGASPSAPPSASAAAASGVDIVAAPAGDEPVASIVAREQERARAEGRDLVIYVGAEWCEPCKRFHEAAAAGQLDAEFPTLRLLELDRDRDEQRLGDADCLTRMIPLFARPTSEGRCDPEKRIMGSIKGPGAVANITPRLRGILQ